MTKAEVRDLVRSVLGRAAIPDEGDVRLTDVGLDSMAMIDLLQAIETTANRRVQPEEITPENFETLDGLHAFLANGSSSS